MRDSWANVATKSQFWLLEPKLAKTWEGGRAYAFVAYCCALFKYFSLKLIFSSCIHCFLRFAERRTDIFGVGAAGAEQTVIGRKLGEEAPQPTKVRLRSSKFLWVLFRLKFL